MPDEIDDNEWLSQYGTIHRLVDGEPFKCCPPYDQEELSMVRGRCTPDEVATSVNPRRTTGAAPGEGVRHATAGELRDAGFRVWHSPTRRNPDHVSVATVDSGGTWTDDDKARFNACFKPPEWKEGHL